MDEASIVSSFGKYRLIASLARGGMARVYLGLMAGPAGFNKLLVLKVMRGGALGDSPDAVRMFMNEARLAARIVHPNIVHTYEVGELDGRPFLAMEYVEGQTYRTLQTRAAGDGLPLADELRILAELARGLHCLHELSGFGGKPLGAVHRDVSPQNVLVGYDGQIRLLDFGIARTDDPDHFTQVGVIKGKIDYIAPEQLRGEGVDRRADVFALGVMLWEALAKQRFAGGASVSEVVKAQARLSGAEPKLRALKPELAEALAELVDQCLALDPAARLADAASFADALEAYLDSARSKPNAKSLSAIMNRLFAEDRDRMRKLVEQQIDQVKRSGFEPSSSEATGLLPRLELKTARTGSTMWSVAPSTGARALYGSSPAAEPSPRTRRLKPRSWAVIAIAAVVAGGAAWFTPGEGAVEATGATEAGASAASAAEPTASGTVRVTVHDAPTGDPPLLASRSLEPKQVANAEGTRSGSPAADLPSATAARSESKVRVDLTVKPSDARVTLDGVALAVPFSGELARDGALHNVRATAPGFVPFRQLVGFDRDRTLDIVLVPAKRPEAVAARPKVAPKSEGRVSPLSLGIDTVDPYTDKKVR